MSAVKPDGLVKSIAENLGIQVTDEALRSLSLDVDYRIRELVQDASKVARKSRRTCILPDDVNQSFRNLNVEPVYGLSNTSDPSRFVRVAGQAQVLRVADPILPLDAVLEKHLPSPPWEAGLRIHWLAVNGKQPRIPENVAMIPPSNKRKRQQVNPLLPEPEVKPSQVTENLGQDSGARDQDNEGGKGNGLHDTPGGVLIKAPLKHVLSKELVLYKNNVIDALESVASQHGNSADRSRTADAVLTSLKLDAGIQPLAPYLCNIFAERIWKECHRETSSDAANQKYHPQKLNIFLRASECIASNGTMDLSWYLHEIIPAILNCLLGTSQVQIDKKWNKETRMQEMSRKLRWEQRDYAAKTIATISTWYPEIGPRVQKAMVMSLQADPVSSLPAIYGAIVGLGALGQRAIQTLLIPNFIPVTLNVASHALSCDARALERVKYALLRTAGHAMCRTKRIQHSSPKFLKQKPKLQNISPELALDNKKTEKEVAMLPLSIFSNDLVEQDPCSLFSSSPESVTIANNWLQKYISEHRMHHMQPQGVYHGLRIQHLGKSRSAVSHAVSATKASQQADVFPAEAGDFSTYTDYASMLNNAYEAFEVPPAQNLVHTVFGAESDLDTLSYSGEDAVQVFV
eukprot:jgi/Picsp_1/4887/NSC_02251-R1_protein